MIDDFVALLRRAGSDLTAEEVASALWLAAYLPGDTLGEPAEAPVAEPVDRESRGGGTEEHAGTAEEPPVVPEKPRPAPAPPPAAGLYLAPRSRSESAAPSVVTRSPGVPALAGKLAIGRAMRALHRTVPARREKVLDEELTAHVAAQTGVLQPLMRAVPEAWLELALVVDRSPSMVLWEATARELRSVFEQLGAFRNVRVWSVEQPPPGTPPVLRRDSGSAVRHSPQELIDPAGRRLVVVFSDCIAPMWRGGELRRWLGMWGRSGSVCILQPLPQRLWHRCAAPLHQVRLRPARSDRTDARLRAEVSDPLSGLPDGAVAIPVLELSPRWLVAGAALIAGTGPPRESVAILSAEPSRIVAGPDDEDGDEDTVPVELSAQSRVQRFRATASPDARRLAEFLAAAPLTLPVMRLVQRFMMPGSQPHDLAEFFLSGLIQRATDGRAEGDPERVEYDFHKGVRQLLLPGLRVGEALRILDRVSAYVNAHLGTSFDFPALLAGQGVTEPASELGRPFASVAYTVLHALGGRYAELAEQLVTSYTPPLDAIGEPMSDRRALVQPDAEGLGSEQMATDHESDRGPAADQPAIWGEVPPRNPEFTGRDKLLTELRRRLSSSITTLLPHTLHGLGGVGKTQLATEYIYRYSSDYDLIWWVPAEQPSEMRSTLARLGRALGLPETEDLSQALAAVYEALRTGQRYRRWLLVFDNAPRAEALTPFLSNPGGGHVLITSRNRNWAGIAEAVEVDVFTRSESQEMIRRRLPHDAAEDADALAEKLGDLPLAVEQAAAWMLATAMPIADYLDLLDKRVSLLAESSPSATYSTPVAVVWGVAFEQLAEQTQEALQLLELCAFFGADPIPVPMLAKGEYAGLPGSLGETVGDDLRLRRAVRDIARYGLAKVDQSRNSIQVHRLVQAVLRDRLQPEERDLYRRSAQRLLAVVDPGDPTDDPGSWERHAEIGPHVVPSGAINGDTADVRRVVLDRIRYLYLRGDFESSRELATRTYAAWQQQLGPSHEQTLVAARYLGNALRITGKTADARVLNAEAYELARQELGMDHEHTLALAISKAADLRYSGDWQEAKDLDEDMLARHIRVLGPHDINTLRCANNLAVDHRLLSDFRTALEVDEPNWGLRRRILGDDHPESLSSSSSVSRDAYGLGDFVRALELQRQWLPVHRRRLGPDHSEVLRATRIHADTLRKAGSFNEAFDLSKEVYQRYRHRFGADHVDTAGAAMTLFGALSRVDRKQDAQALGYETLSQYRRLLGESHPFTLVCMTNLAILLRTRGEYEQAHDLDDRALHGLERALGQTHVYTMCATTNHANNIAQLRDHRRARRMLEPNLERARRYIGASHPETLACAGNLAMDLQATGDLGRSRELRDETVTGLRNLLSGVHPDLELYFAGHRFSCEIDPPTL